MRRRLLHCAIAGSAVLACASWTPFARADPSESEVATARKLFEQGLALEDAQKWGAALERFQRVEAVKATPQVRYNLGVCQENLGKLVEAWNQFSQVADANGDPALTRLSALAAAHLEGLKNRIPSVTLRLAPNAANAANASPLVVELDGAIVAPRLLGTPMLVNPGHHELRVTAQGARAAAEPRRTTTTFEIGSDKKPLVITLLTPQSAAPPRHAALPDAPPAKVRVSPLVFAAAGIGASALVGALVVALVRGGAISDLDAVCGPNRQACPSDKRDAADRIFTYTAAANVLVGVGIAGIATAGIVLLVSPSKSQPTGVAWQARF